MSKSELLQKLESLSREDLEEVAERVDQLRGVGLTEKERALVRDRIIVYRKNPEDLIELDDAVSDILNNRK
jgi:hypothetical protein